MVGEEYHPTKLRLVGLQEQEGEDRTPGALQERLSWLMELCNCQAEHFEAGRRHPVRREDFKNKMFSATTHPRPTYVNMVSRELRDRILNESELIHRATLDPDTGEGVRVEKVKISDNYGREQRRRRTSY